MGLVQLGEGNKQEKEGGKDGVQSSRNLGGGQGSAFLFHGWGSRKPLGWHNLQESGQETSNYQSDMRNTQPAVRL